MDRHTSRDLKIGLTSQTVRGNRFVLQLSRAVSSRTQVPAANSERVEIIMRILTTLLCVTVLIPWLILVQNCRASSKTEMEPRMSSERVVFVTEYGNIEFGFFPEVWSLVGSV